METAIILTIICIGTVITILIIKFILPERPSENQNSLSQTNSQIFQTSINEKPSQEKINDKLVIVKNASYEDLKNAINEFCSMYNEKKIAALPRLTKISDDEFAITFPYDIDFEIYCFFVNFIHYPMETKYNPKVLAWTTAKQTDDWITEQSANKRIMLFIPEDDSEYDNVFLTTEDNIGYKLGFAVGEEKQLLQTPKKKFISPNVEINSLKEKQFEDFQ